ncbi:MAG: LicD family protein, partial [Lachnospiraceae bacterium]|nr:LicD family protein [Lachnospiraceae bacterium]
KRITIDYFPMDHIKEYTDFKTYWDYRSSVRARGDVLPREEQGEFFRKAEAENPYRSDVQTSKLFLGVDLTRRWFEAYNAFLPSDFIFPLQRLPFEDTEFWCPADPEGVLNNFMQVDYEQYPGEFATYNLPTHEERYDIWFREYGKKAELIVTSEEELKTMLPLYNDLRDNNVFALFISRIPGDVWGSIPDKYEVRWSAYRDFRSQYAVAMSESAYLKDYKNEKIIFEGNTKEALDRICDK